MLRSLTFPQVFQFSLLQNSSHSRGRLYPANVRVRQAGTTKSYLSFPTANFRNIRTNPMIPIVKSAAWSHFCLGRRQALAFRRIAAICREGTYVHSSRELDGPTTNTYDLCSVYQSVCNNYSEASVSYSWLYIVRYLIVWSNLSTWPCGVGTISSMQAVQYSAVHVSLRSAINTWVGALSAFIHHIVCILSISRTESHSDRRN